MKRVRGKNFEIPPILATALDNWLDWVMKHAAEHALPVGTTLEERALRMLTATSGHSDPVFAALAQSERSGCGEMLNLHRQLSGLPRPHRVALVALALGKTQSFIAEEIGVRQQLVGTVIRVAVAELGQALRLLEFTRSRALPCR